MHSIMMIIKFLSTNFKFKFKDLDDFILVFWMKLVSWHLGQNNNTVVIGYYILNCTKRKSNKHFVGQLLAYEIVLLFFAAVH